MMCSLSNDKKYNWDYEDDESEIITPKTIPPKGYKLIIHRYYTEIVPINTVIPKTPLKTNKMFDYFDYNNNVNNKV